MEKCSHILGASTVAALSAILIIITVINGRGMKLIQQIQNATLLFALSVEINLVLKIGVMPLSIVHLYARGKIDILS